MKKYDFGLNFVSILFDFVYHKYETLQKENNETKNCIYVIKSTSRFKFRKRVQRDR